MSKKNGTALKNRMDLDNTIMTHAENTVIVDTLKAKSADLIRSKGVRFDKAPASAAKAPKTPSKALGVDDSVVLESPGKFVVGGPDQNIKVFLRVRPLSHNELLKGHDLCIAVDSNSSVLLYPNRDSFADADVEKFFFDHVFDPASSQVDVYETLALPLLQSFLSGNNALLFAYGVTSAGKTYTILGSEESPGILPRIVSEACAAVTAHNNGKDHPAASMLEAGQEYSLRISFMENLRDDLFDLLQPPLTEQDKREGKRRPALKMMTVDGISVKGLKEIDSTDETECSHLLSVGRSNMKRSATSMNADSSRSHGVFTIKLVKRPAGTIGGPESWTELCKFAIIDLAGSERAKKAETAGQQLEEAGNINKSLLVLGKCLEAMRWNQKNKVQKPVPFRESKITQLISDLLIGNARSVMIVNASPSFENMAETALSLRFASVAKDIKVGSRVDSWRKAKKDLARPACSTDFMSYESVNDLVAEIQQIHVREKAELEALIRSEIANEMKSKFEDLERAHETRLKMEVSISENKYEKKMELLKRELTRWQAEERDSTEEAQQLRQDLRTREERIAVLQDELKAYKTKCEQRQKLLDETDALMANLREQLRQETAKNMTLAQEIKELREVRDAKVPKLEEKISTLEREITKGQGYEQFLRARVEEEKEREREVLKIQHKADVEKIKAEMSTAYDMRAKGLETRVKQLEQQNESLVKQIEEHMARANPASTKAHEIKPKASPAAHIDSTCEEPPVLHHLAPLSGVASGLRHNIVLPKDSKIASPLKQKHLMTPGGKPRFERYELEDKRLTSDATQCASMLWKGDVKPSPSGEGVNVTFSSVESLVSARVEKAAAVERPAPTPVITVKPPPKEETIADDVMIVLDSEEEEEEAPAKSSKGKKKAATSKSGASKRGRKRQSSQMSEGASTTTETDEKSEPTSKRAKRGRPTKRKQEPEPEDEDEEEEEEVEEEEVEKPKKTGLMSKLFGRGKKQESPEKPPAKASKKKLYKGTAAGTMGLCDEESQEKETRPTLAAVTFTPVARRTRSRNK